MKTYKDYILQAVEGLVAKKNNRDLGKFFAESNEYFHIDWVNENCSFKVIKRDEDENDTDVDESGYDIISYDKKLKIQSKIRATTVHLEQTKRKSGKNLRKENNTGHVRYNLNDFDVLLLSRPDVNNYVNMDNWNIIAIPIKNLEDPKTPGYCYANVPKKVWSKYLGKTVQTLESVYESVSSR